MEIVLSDARISVTDLRRDPLAAIEAAEKAPVALLVHNKPSAYLVSVATYTRIVEALEDAKLTTTVRARAKEQRIKVALD